MMTNQAKEFEKELEIFSRMFKEMRAIANKYDYELFIEQKSENVSISAKLEVHKK